MNMTMRIFAQITKVDVAKREVWGRAVQEVEDNAKEIFDYATSKPYFEKWSNEFAKATDGKSLGNVRAMHGQVAAGKLIAFLPQDVEKAIDIGTRIVDDQEWSKVLEGVYTGFSIGGKYVRKWKDGTCTRYTANPNEVSLVDKPCVPTAQFFDIVKADGVVTKGEFKKRSTEAAIDELADMLSKGTVSPEQLIDLVKREVDPADDESGGDENDSDLDQGGDELVKPDEVSQADWDDMTDDEKSAAVEANKAKKDDDAEMADNPEFTKLSAEEQNKLVEARARTLATHAFTKLEPAAQAGKTADADWQNYVPEALRECKKIKKSEPKPAAVQVAEAMPDGSFPIQKADDIKGAVQALDRAKDKDAVKAHIIARAQALNAANQLPDDWTAKGEPAAAKKDATPALTPLSKLLDDVIKAMQDDLSVLTKLEDPACGGDELKGAISKALNGELADKSIVEQRAAALVKYGARHSKDDSSRLQSIHDHSVGMGAQCTMADDKNPPASPQKADQGMMLKLATTETELTGLKKTVNELAELGVAMAKQLKAFRDAPAAPKGRLRAIGKEEDKTTDDPINKDDKIADPGVHDPDSALKLIKGELTRVGVRKG